jgi:hypothetical protein
MAEANNNIGNNPRLKWKLAQRFARVQAYRARKLGAIIGWPRKMAQLDSIREEIAVAGKTSIALA